MDKYYIDKEDALLLVIDIQERLAPAINNKERIIDKARIMISGAKTLGVPVVVTEQYPKGLGPTISELKDLVKGDANFSKVEFSACTEEVMDYLERAKRNKIVIIGMETHICVLQ